MRCSMEPSTRSETHVSAERVRAIARDAGAARVAIASLDAQGDGASARDATFADLAASFARGDLATWGFDDAYAATASDPRALLPGARSVLCIAIPYANVAGSESAERARRSSAGPRGRVSNYAWSRDYHRHVRGILQRIAEAIDALASAKVTRVACDTVPLAERAFARASGLGWVGKHTNLIAPELGSFVFLGEIVTTLALVPGAPLKKTCGTCTRCIVACPTGALRGDYTIDATRCISDLTQRTDAIPRALRPLIGDWVWGCDLCGLACPPSRNATAAIDAVFAPLDADAAAPPLVELLELRSGAYKRRYRASAMGWRGAAILRRNAAIALGNAGDRATVPALVRALTEDPHPLVRGHVAWALGRIGSPAAWAALAARRALEGDQSVLAEIDAAFSDLERASENGNLRHRWGVEAP